ncbi:Uncharacterised protein [Bordetella pertussis]|nr:Uncharacterised protein [Bordetella pertussis]
MFDRPDFGRQVVAIDRLLPGKSKRASTASASGVKRLTGTPSARALVARKCWASAGISSTRSRSGGRRRRITLRRWNRSSRNRPCSTRCSSGWWVAATMRTSTRTGCAPPTR